MKKTLAQKKTERCEKKNEKLFLFTVMSLNTLEKKKLLLLQMQQTNQLRNIECLFWNYKALKYCNHKSEDLCTKVLSRRNITHIA